MPWIIGIDEAGYGPNLGPLVMTSVAIQAPEELAGGDLWDRLHTAVRRVDDPSDGRIVVADSKLVYSPARGLADLETAVLAIHLAVISEQVTNLADFLQRLCPRGLEELRREAWFDGSTFLPVAAGRDECAAAARALRLTSEQQELTWGLIRSVVVCPSRFNVLIERWGSKGAVLSLALVELLQENNRAIEDREAVHVCIDKHGGRNNYAPVLQPAYADDLVLAYEESRTRSVYRVARAAQPVTITFEPRADSGHFCVALASLFSKYLRELLMLEFNRFWQRYVPDLKPTAGYPLDATRFFAAIAPALKRLQIAETTVWRRR